MKKPVNTTEEVHRDPMSFLLSAMVMGSDGAIEYQEKSGQSDFVRSETLPVRISVEDKAKLEASGVKFLERVTGDELFQYVTLPDGWKKVPTTHSMWSELQDADGKKVAAIFYKAAFYDRDAFLHLA